MFNDQNRILCLHYITFKIENYLQLKQELINLTAYFNDIG